jgi:hypothetical protein
VWAGDADVLDVEVTCKPAPGQRPASICHFSVTVRHADSGWDHYANRFEVLDEAGAVLATRILRHPHLEEQPFRRGLGRVRIPWDVGRVKIRANDLVHELGGKEMTVAVPHARGEPGAETNAE